MSPAPESEPTRAEGELADRLAKIRQRIVSACLRAGRDPASVRLVGASKMQPVAALRAAMAAGLSVFGENRVQEAVSKAAELPAAVEWHLFGPLQSNKARPAAQIFSVVHSLDRPRIARVLDREVGGLGGPPMPCFVEINLAGEASKHGFAPEQLGEALDPLRELPNIRLIGLMAVPPYTADPEASRPNFRRLRMLRDDLAGRPDWEGFEGRLSMGMSNDFEVAIEEGATDVRIGTALFGRRPG